MICGLQNRRPDCAKQSHIGFYESPAERLGAALTHSKEPMEQLLSLAKTWLRIPLIVREAIASIAMNAT
jgi:hypothetical protein